MNIPLISIVIPVFNRAHSLALTLDSVLIQEEGYEVIVVDDGSIDEIDVLVQRYAQRGVTFLRNSVNRGVGVTRNRGVHAAKGDWVAFLDSDSYLLPGAIAALQTAILECDDKVGVVYGKSEQINSRKSATSSISRPRRWNYQDYLQANQMEEALPVTRREILLQFPFDENLDIKRECGSLVWFAIGRAGYEFVWTRDLVQRYELSPDGLSGRRFLAAHPEEMVVCNQEILKRFGEDLGAINRQRLIRLHEKTAFYCLMADRRPCAFRHAKAAWKLSGFNLRALILFCLCGVGPRTARRLYPVVASVGA